jgi:hypothetical protein
VDDSKKLFSQRRGLRDLEEGLLPFVQLLAGGPATSFRGLLESITPSGERLPTAYLDDYPWYRGRDVTLPRNTYASALEARTERLRRSLEQAGVELLALKARPLEVSEFNQLVEAEESKANVSFRAIGQFVSGLWRHFAEESVHVVVDRQGGRRYYGPLLFKAVHPRGLRVEKQSRTLSLYELTRAGEGGGPFRVAFTTSGDARSLPVALASMLSKYVREIHMLLLNRFWLEQLTDLKPTAGYAVDASRFLRDTEALRRRLAIDDRLLVRSR